MTADSKNNIYGQWSRNRETDHYLKSHEIEPYFDLYSSYLISEKDSYEKSYGIEPLFKKGTQPLYERLYK